MKMRSITSISLSVALLVSMIALASCGGDDDDDTNVVVNEDVQQEEQGPVETGPTIVINNRITQNIILISQTRIANTDMIMNWQCANVDTVIHKQFIHVSTRCPTLAQDDANGDGILDQVEVQQAVGPAVMALDANLTDAQETEFPSGEAFIYNQTIPLATLRQTVPQGQDFIVMINGVNADTQLPATVQNNSADPVNLTIPVACKVFEAPALEEAAATTTTGGATTGTTTSDAAAATTAATTDAAATATAATTTTGGAATGGTI